MYRQSKLACLVIFLAGNSRLLLTYYKINSSQSKGRSRNSAALKKYLLAKEVNEKLKNVHSCLRTLILDAARFLGLPLKLSNPNYLNVTQNMTISDMGNFKQTALLEFGLASLIYDSHSD